YEATYRALVRPFACVNAATMWRVAGDVARSRALASDALKLVTTADANSDYWALATAAEARLLLDDQDGARTALAQAMGLGPDVADRASTRRQLALVCAISGCNHALLEVLHIPRVIHYTGHMVAVRDHYPRILPREEPRVAAELSRLLEGR